MNYYDNEVMIIPANITIDAITDLLCGIYECPVTNKGQFSSRANGHPLYIAFKAGGEIKTLYKVKSVLSLDFDDKKTIDDYDKEIEKGIQKYPDFKKRVDRYKKKHNPLVSGLKWVFLIDFQRSIDLYYPVHVPSGARGTEYRALKEIFNSPAKQDKGRIVLDLPPKSVGKTSKNNSTANQSI